MNFYNNKLFTSLIIFVFLVLNSTAVKVDQAQYTPKSLCVRLSTNTTAVVQWFEPVSLRDEIMGYTIYYTKDPELPLKDWNFTVTGNYPLATVRNIELGVVYTFRIRLHALNMERPGPISEDYSFKMVNRSRSCYDQPKTTSIRSLNILRASATSYTSVEVWWNIPYDPHLHTGYCIIYKNNSSQVWQNVTVGLVQNVELMNLQPSAIYTISLAIISTSGLDHFIQETTVKVQPEEIPLDIVMYDITTHSVMLKWAPPTRFQPIRYRVTYDAFKEYEDSTGTKQRVQIPKNELVINGGTTQYFLNELLPNTNYNINISAIPVDHSYRPASKITITTKMAAPQPLVKPDINKTVKGGNVQVLLPKASDEFGPIGHYYVIVVPQTEIDDLPSSSYLIEDMMGFNSNTEPKEDAAYIAAKFDKKVPWGFILGNGEEYGGFINQKLKSGKKYRLFVRAVVDFLLEELFTDSPYSDVFYLDMPEWRSKPQNVLIK